MKLLTRSAVAQHVKLENVYYLSNIDIVFLPAVTNNIVGAIGINVIEDTIKTANTNVVTDFMLPKLLTQHKVSLVKLKIESVRANQEYALYGISLSGFLGNAYIYG